MSGIIEWNENLRSIILSIPSSLSLSSSLNLSPSLLSSPLYSRHFVRGWILEKTFIFPFILFFFFLWWWWLRQTFRSPQTTACVVWVKCVFPSFTQVSLDHHHERRTSLMSGSWMQGIVVHTLLMKDWERKQREKDREERKNSHIPVVQRQVLHEARGEELERLYLRGERERKKNSLRERKEGERKKERGEEWIDGWMDERKGIKEEGDYFLAKSIL